MNIPSWLAGKRVLCPRCPDSPIAFGSVGGDKKADLADEFTFRCPLCGGILRLRKPESLKAEERRKLAQEFASIGRKPVKPAAGEKNPFGDLSDLLDGDFFGTKKKKK